MEFSHKSSTLPLLSSLRLSSLVNSLSLFLPVDCLSLKLSVTSFSWFRRTSLNSSIANCASASISVPLPFPFFSLFPVLSFELYAIVSHFLPFTLSEDLLPMVSHTSLPTSSKLLHTSAFLFLYSETLSPASLSQTTTWLAASPNLR